jgi:hypothetical protein
MTNIKLKIKRLVLKSACAAQVKDFYDPFTSFYILPLVVKIDDQVVLLVDRLPQWVGHTVHVSYSNTRQMSAREYPLAWKGDFELHLYLVQQKADLATCWRDVQEHVQELTGAAYATTDFESYPLVNIPIAWEALEELEYENECLILELCKKKI